LGCMDSSAAAQSELLVALAESIGYKCSGRRVLKANGEGSSKKQYEKPLLRIYGDVRRMTEAVASTHMHRDGKMSGFTNLKTS